MCFPSLLYQDRHQKKRVAWEVLPLEGPFCDDDCANDCGDDCANDCGDDCANDCGDNYANDCGDNYANDWGDDCANDCDDDCANDNESGRHIPAVAVFPEMQT